MEESKPDNKDILKVEDQHEYDLTLSQYDKEKLLLVRSYSEQAFDKQIVYISGGGLALSLGFINQLITINTSLYTWLVYVSWALFTITLTLNLISHKFSTNSIDKFLDDKFKQGHKWNKYTSVLNTFTIVFLISAIAMQIIFIIINLENG